MSYDVSFEPVGAGGELTITEPILRNDPRFKKFVDEILLTRGPLGQLCGDRLVDYGSDSQDGLASKVIHDGGLSQDERQRLADDAGRDDGAIDQHVLVLSRLRGQVVGFLLAREMAASSDDPGLLVVHIDLVCRDSKEPEAKGYLMFEKLENFYRKSGVVTDLRFTLDAIDDADVIGAYEKWGFSRIVNRKGNPSTNSHNATNPMMKRLTRENAAVSDWTDDRSAGRVNRFIRPADEMRVNGDFERSRYYTEQVI